MSGAALADEIAIDDRFPGGNIVVESIVGDTVTLHQDQRDTPQFWFHWSFRVRGAAGRELTFHFTRGNVFGTRGPAVSTDDGRVWSWLGAAAVQGDAFTYRFGPQESDTRFAFAIPYVASDLRRFLERQAGSRRVARKTLGRTPAGRDIELLRAGRLDGGASERILITCRHHACESIANFVLEGILEAALEDTPEGQWFGEHVELIVVPFMDTDGVEEGDQGKLRSPHDHWLDYAGDSRYASVRELRRRFDEAGSQPLTVALDIHCPYIRDQKLYFAHGSNPRIAAESLRLCRLLEQRQTGPWVYRQRDDSPFGTGWNTAATYEGRRSFWQWAETLPGLRAATTLEVPYASVGEAAVDPDSARAFGKDVAAALRGLLTR